MFLVLMALSPASPTSSGSVRRQAAPRPRNSPGFARCPSSGAGSGTRRRRSAMPASGCRVDGLCPCKPWSSQAACWLASHDPFWSSGRSPKRPRLHQNPGHPKVNAGIGRGDACRTSKRHAGGRSRCTGTRLTVRTAAAKVAAARSSQRNLAPMVRAWTHVASGDLCPRRSWTTLVSSPLQFNRVATACR